MIRCWVLHTGTDSSSTKTNESCSRVYHWLRFGRVFVLLLLLLVLVEKINLKQSWLLAFWNKLQTHKSLNIFLLFIFYSFFLVFFLGTLISRGRHKTYVKKIIGASSFIHTTDWQVKDDKWNMRIVYLCCSGCWYWSVWTCRVFVPKLRTCFVLSSQNQPSFQQFLCMALLLLEFVLSSALSLVARSSYTKSAETLLRR